MKLKYQIGDVLKFDNAKFIVIGTPVHYTFDCYRVKPLDNNFYKTKPLLERIMNSNFIEKHCTQIKGQEANTLRILYGPTRQDD